MEKQTMIVMYVVCGSPKEAGIIGKELVEKHLVACSNIIDTVNSCYIWPPNTEKIVNDRETVLLAKTIESKFEEIEKVVKSLHSYDVPAILSFPVYKVSDDYYKWVLEQVK